MTGFEHLLNTGYCFTYCIYNLHNPSDDSFSRGTTSSTKVWMFEVRHMQPLFTCHLHLDFSRQLTLNGSSWWFPFTFFSTHSLPELNSWHFHPSKGSGPKLEGHPQLLLLFSYLCSVFQQIQWAWSSKHIPTVSAPPWLPPLPVLTTTTWHWNNHGSFLASTLASLKAVLHLVAIMSL